MMSAMYGSPLWGSHYWSTFNTLSYDTPIYVSVFLLDDTDTGVVMTDWKRSAPVEITPEEPRALPKKPECPHMLRKKREKKELKSVKKPPTRQRRSSRLHRRVNHHSKLVKRHRRHTIHQPKSTHQGFGRHGHRTA
jgi:hypothetical protein